MRFVNPKNDVAFKKIFGNEKKKDILISFLNAVLDLSGDREIQDIEILNPYQAPRIEELKYTMVDVQARDRRGVTFIVEMQVEYVPDFTRRFLYYGAKTYVSQIGRGDDYPRLNQVIFIGVLDYMAFEGEDYLTRHLILNSRTLRQEITDLEFNFIELPKFKKREDELETVLDKWIYFIKHASGLDMVPEHADFPAIREAYDEANKFGWNWKELETYDNHWIEIQDERGARQAAEERGLRAGLEKGLQQGLQEGLQQGIERGRLLAFTDTVRRMLGRGFGHDDIADVTGLSPHEVATLVDEIARQ